MIDEASCVYTYSEFSPSIDFHPLSCITLMSDINFKAFVKTRLNTEQRSIIHIPIEASFYILTNSHDTFQTKHTNINEQMIAMGKGYI